MYTCTGTLPTHYLWTSLEWHILIMLVQKQILQVANLKDEASYWVSTFWFPFVAETWSLIPNLQEDGRKVAKTLIWTKRTLKNGCLEKKLYCFVFWGGKGDQWIKICIWKMATPSYEDIRSRASIPWYFDCRASIPWYFEEVGHLSPDTLIVCVYESHDSWLTHQSLSKQLHVPV